MSKAVAVKGDTQAVTSKGKHPGDTNRSGTWQPVGEPIVTRGKTISVNGKKVELSAVMEWTYINGSANNTSVGPFPDRAELKASLTKLTDVDQHVLVEGDEVTTTHGNKIIVTKSQDILKTA